jgi:hypothetical protein
MSNWELKMSHKLNQNFDIDDHHFYIDLIKNEIKKAFNEIPKTVRWGIACSQAIEKIFKKRGIK